MIGLSFTKNTLPERRLPTMNKAIQKKFQHQAYIKTFANPANKAQLDRLIDEVLMRERAKMETEIASKVIAATLVVMHDKYGWKGKCRLPRLMNQIFAQFEAVNEKYIKVDDFYKILAELGVKIDMKG